MLKVSLGSFFNVETVVVTGLEDAAGVVATTGATAGATAGAAAVLADAAAVDALCFFAVEAAEGFAAELELVLVLLPLISINQIASLPETKRQQRKKVLNYSPMMEGRLYNWIQ